MDWKKIIILKIAKEGIDIWRNLQIPIDWVSKRFLFLIECFHTKAQETLDGFNSNLNRAWVFPASIV